MSTFSYLMPSILSFLSMVNALCSVRTLLDLPPPVGPTTMSPCLCGNDSVATRPRHAREARGLSCDRIGGVEALRHRVDAIAATASS